MALRGSIDDVPIVDVLQFVHLSGKSGVLSLVSEAGPACVEFSQGNIVFARGPQTRSLGELLVASGALGAEALERAMLEQRADPDRPPLGRILIARQLITADKLAEAVHRQIHEAMMDVANWHSGEFQFDQTNIETLDDIRVEVAEVLPLLKLNTQFLLFEAVRLFDERQRDKELGGKESSPAPSSRPPARGEGDDEELAFGPPAAASVVSGEKYLGLSPTHDQVWSTPAPKEPRITAEPTLPPTNRPQLPAPEPTRRAGASALEEPKVQAGIVLVGFEKAIAPVVQAALAKGGYRVLGHVPRREVERQFLSERRWPPGMVVLWRVQAEGVAAGEQAQSLKLMDRLLQRYPAWSLVALVSGWDAGVVGRLYATGARAALPLDPMQTAHGPASALDGLLAVVGQIWKENQRAAAAQAAELRAWVQAKRLTSEMQRALQKASISLELMRVAANTFERATLFLAKEEELIGLGAFGLTTSGQPMAESLRGLAVTVTEGTPLSRCLQERTAFAGGTRELGLGQLFFDIAGRPLNDRGVLVPLVGPSKTIGVLYGDNGLVPGPLRGIHAMEIAAAQAGIAYENVLLRMRLDVGRRTGGDPEIEAMR